MTLVLAGWLDDQAILSADRRTHEGPPGGPYRPAEGDKLFDIGGCAVASFGGSPNRVSVPAFIRTFASHRWKAGDLANAIHVTIAKLPDRGDFGLLVCGVRTEYPRRVGRSNIDSSERGQLDSVTYRFDLIRR